MKSKQLKYIQKIFKRIHPMLDYRPYLASDPQGVLTAAKVSDELDKFIILLKAIHGQTE